MTTGMSINILLALLLVLSTPRPLADTALTDVSLARGPVPAGQDAWTSGTAFPDWGPEQTVAITGRAAWSGVETGRPILGPAEALVPAEATLPEPAGADPQDETFRLANQAALRPVTGSELVDRLRHDQPRHDRWLTLGFTTSGMAVGRSAGATATRLF